MQGMKKFILFFLGPLLLFARPEVADWCHPTVEEFKTLQRYLCEGEREELDLLHMRPDSRYGHLGIDKPRVARIRKFGIIEDDAVEIPSLKRVVFNTDENDRDFCLITYASLSRNYPDGVKRLIRGLKRVGFKGHLLYRIGGWPYIEKGGLKLFDVPYAFKPLAFMEARDLGYKMALWVDVSLIPLRDPTPIKNHLAKCGIAVQRDPFPLWPIATDTFLESMGINFQLAQNIAHIQTAALGFNFDNKRAMRCLEAYYDAALRRTPFFSRTPCQACLSVLVHQMGLTGGFYRGKMFAAGPRKGAFFWLNRNFEEDL